MAEMQHMKQNIGSPLGLSTSQAAQALGVSLGTIRRWSDMGYLQSYRTPGGQRRFSQEQIDQFVGSLEQQQTTQPQQSARPAEQTYGIGKPCARGETGAAREPAGPISPRRPPG